MSLRISKSNKSLHGKISLVSSKSISNRLLIIRALSDKPFQIRNLSEARDTVLLESLLKLNSQDLNVEDAGTPFRFLTAFLSVKPGEWHLSGNSRMKIRPVGPLVEALRQIGAEIEYLEEIGFPPLQIRGKKLSGGDVKVDSGLSSQFVSALLLIAPTLKNGLSIEFRGLVSSRPYVELTLGIMAEFGIQYLWNEHGLVIPGQPYKLKEIAVESDWSAAAFWYQQAALSEEADLFLEGLSEKSLQGDSVISDWMKKFGIETTFFPNGIGILKRKNARQPLSIEKNFINHPDLVPAMACLCAGLGIHARFHGLRNLRMKESDRLAVLQSELKKLGSRITLDASGDGLEIHPSVLKQSEEMIVTHDDHRIAMAIAPLSMLSGPIILDDEKVVQKSYPGFWKDMQTVGYDLDFSI